MPSMSVRFRQFGLLGKILLTFIIFLLLLYIRAVTPRHKIDAMLDENWSIILVYSILTLTIYMIVFFIL